MKTLVWFRNALVAWNALLVAPVVAKTAGVSKGSSKDKDHDNQIDIYNVTRHGVTTSRVVVHIPASLHTNTTSPTGGITEEHVKAHFGAPQRRFSAGSLAASVRYAGDANDPLCAPVDWSKQSSTNSSTDDLPPPSPFILLATSKGPCSAVTKARHAQHAGAAALLLADDTCRCADTACTGKYGGKDPPQCRSNVTATPILVDDGSGSDVSIPTFWLYKMAAQPILETLQAKKQPVLMELEWGLVKSAVYDAVTDDSDDNDGKTPAPVIPSVVYHFWTTAHDPVLDLLTYKNIQKVSSAFAPTKAVFEPRFSLISGAQFDCVVSNSTTTTQSNSLALTNVACDDLCTNEGRYCATAARNLTGRMIVTETLRRLCVWQHYGKSYQQDEYNEIVANSKSKKKKTSNKKDKKNPYWAYLLYHLDHCAASDQYANPDCIKNAYAHANLDTKVMDECMGTETGPLDQDIPNTLLEEALQHQEHAGVNVLPALMVNWRVTESCSSWQLFSAICADFWYKERPAPDICYSCSSCPNTIGCIEQGGKCVPYTKPDDSKKDDGKKGDSSGDKSGSSKKETHHVRNFFLFVFVCAAAYGGWYYYHNFYAVGHGYGGAERSGGLLNGYLQLNTEG